MAASTTLLKNIVVRVEALEVVRNHAELLAAMILEGSASEDIREAAESLSDRISRVDGALTA